MFKNKWLLGLLVVALATSTAWGQGGPRGAISGVVKDESGAVVPGATIKITNTDTGTVERQVVSGSDGVFFANLLPIGTYSLEVAAKGFSRAEAPGIRVRVTETTTVPITLKIGAVEQSITVTDAASPLMYSSPATGQSITKVGDLPLATRNLLQLLALSPGTSTDLSDTGDLGRGRVSIEVNGQRATNNNYQVEGVNSNDYNLPQFDYVPVPNSSAVAEFKTQTSLYDASQGRNAGGNIQVALKSGASKFHGEAFEFFRNEKLNANDWFLNRVGKPRPVLKQNQLGGSFGGPIPKTGAFFFLNYQGTRQRSGLATGTQLNSLIISLPQDRSAANLSRLFGVPAAQIHPVALRLLNLQGTHFGGPFLIPSVPAEVAGAHARGRLVLSRPGSFQDDQFVTNFDKSVGDRDRFSVRWFFSDNEQSRPFGGAGILPQPRREPRSNRLLTLAHTRVFGPATVNEFRFGFNRFTFALAPTELIKLSDIGATRPNAGDFPAAFQFSVAAPGFSIGTGVNDDRGGAFNTFTWTDTFSKTWGKHSIRVGAQFDRYQLNRFNRFATRGSASFTARGGNTAFQNFLLGNITATQGGAGFFNNYFRTTDFAAFAQDDWKLTPRLTVNLGLRWEPIAISRDKFNIIGNLSGINDDEPVRFVFPEDLTLRNLGTPGVKNCTLKNCRDWRNLAPRFGFAWDPTGSQRWAIRGGYGVYFQRISNQTLLQSFSGPGVFSQAVSDTGVPLENPFQRLRPQSDFPLDPLPIARLVSVAGGGLGSATFTGPSPGFLFFADRNLRTPYTQQWNLTVQRQIGRGWVAETGYVGTKGTALLHNNPLNQAILATATNPLTQPTTTGSVTITGSTLDNIDARVPTKFLGIGIGRLLPVTNDGASTYHSWQNSLTRRWAENYFQAAYTWAKAIDNTSGSLSTDELNGNLMWNGNQRLSRGLADFDRTHRLVLSYSYEFPFFRSATGLKRHVLGGWGTNGVFTFQTGNPFTVYDSGGGSLLGLDICCLATANVAQGRTYESAKKSGSVQKRLDEYFDTKAFTTVPCVDAQLRPVASCNDPRAAGTLIGNAGRNILRGPFQQNWDFSIFKRFRITESHALEFRTEFFNLWNQPVFASPGCGVGPCGLPSVDIQAGASAGAIESTANRPRVIQLVLKYTF